MTNKAADPCENSNNAAFPTLTCVSYFPCCERKILLELRSSGVVVIDLGEKASNCQLC